MNHSQQDPWTWGYDDNAVEENQHNDWSSWGTTTTVSSDFKKTKISDHKEIPTHMKHPPAGADYFDSINLHSSSQVKQHNILNDDSIKTNFVHYMQQSNASNYFNNNSQPDVENKEIVAPADNRTNRNSEQDFLLTKDVKQGRSHQDEIAVSTSQMNQNVQISANAGPPPQPLANFMFGSKQCNQQDIFFNTPQANNPKTVFNTAPNTSFPPLGLNCSNAQNNSILAQSIHSFAPPIHPSLPINDSLSRNQLPPTGFSELIPPPPSRKEFDSFSGPNSLPPTLHMVHNTSVTAPQSLDYSTHSSNVVTNTVPNTSQVTDLFSREKLDITTSLFPPLETGPAQQEQQRPSSIAVGQQHHLSEISSDSCSQDHSAALNKSQPISTNTAPNNSNIPIESDYNTSKSVEIASSNHTIPPQFPHSSKTEEGLHPNISALCNKQTVDNDEIFSVQVTHQSQEVIDNAKSFTTVAGKTPSLLTQEIFLDESHMTQSTSIGSHKSTITDFNVTPLDVNQSSNVTVPSYNVNTQNLDKEKDNTSIQTKFSPAPQYHPSNSQIPPATSNNSTASNAVPSSVKSSSNNNSISSTCQGPLPPPPQSQQQNFPPISVQDENLHLDNDNNLFGSSLSRSQISFNLQNVHPVASSSPVAGQQNIPDNQERLPENHEMPDNTENLHLDMKNLTINNREQEIDAQIHCQVDRNQYLETGHLSGSKDHILIDNSPNVEALDESEAPPPGLYRLVTGQGCETRGPVPVGEHPMHMIGAESSVTAEDNRLSSPSSSTAGSDSRNAQNGPVGESEGHGRAGRLVQGQSIGDDTDGLREVPGEATPFHNRIVLGQMGRDVTPPIMPDNNNIRGDNGRDREVLGRMVLGERYDRDLSQTGNSQDDFRQSHRSRIRSRRGESSYEDEDHDYPSDRNRRDEYKRRNEDRPRHRNRREHRSPEYRSDEEFEDRRGFSRMGRNERRSRDFSPEREYYRDYYRDDHRRSRRYEHYRDREYEDDYYYRENRSRPSSRTGSDYRRVNMDYMCGRNPRQIFYPDLGAIPYNPRAPEEYYEAMRRLDPMGYAAWYNQYMSSRYNAQQAQNNYNNDRASVHSGQSSTNRQNVETPQASVEEMGREEDLVNATAHVKGKIDSCGRLIIIDPHYPMDNQRVTVNLYKYAKLPTDPDLDEFLECSGPFVPGVTHRNTVLQYLKMISDKSTKSSEKLLYDLIHLAVKSNGELNGLDVADLLMESYKKSQKEESPTVSETISEPLSPGDPLSKFRELLQQGNKTEALEWAIDHGAWGHALFLASKMDDRTHNNIMLRFANSIPHNDPLQTLYQLMSGHVPQASTCCADKKWSDWRPHLAMILGNPTGNSKLDKKAIIKLGDSLFSRGRIFASHFCYIMAQVDFTNYQSEAKFVLLGSSPNQEFTKFATCRAILVTMCYEYGLKLRQPNANIPPLQLYKLILATRLVDNSKCRVALQYCELIANEAVQSDCCEKSLICACIELSSRLKMQDPTLALTGDVETDPDWIAKLKNYYNNLAEDYDAGLATALIHGISSSTVSEVEQENIALQEKVENEETPSTIYNPPLESSQNTSGNQMEFTLPSTEFVPQPLHSLPPLAVQTTLPSEIVHQEEQQSVSLPPLSSNSYASEPFLHQSAADPYWSSSNGIASQNPYPRQDTIETPVSNAKNNFFKASEEHLKLNEISKESNRNSKKAAENKISKSEEAQQGGWFGGILDKFIRPKNQMRLPDDSNPSIVWDEQKKRWVNLDGDNDGPPPAKPPPRLTETPNVVPQPLAPSTEGAGAAVGGSSVAVPPPMPGGNKYKIQKGKLMKSNYVNIMGNSTNNPPSQVRPMDGLFPAPVQSANTNFFVPPPVEGNEYSPIDFINPGQVATPSNKPSEANLENKQEFPQGITAPTMYNPARYPISSNDC